MSGSGTTTYLAELARRHVATHKVIWCELEEDTCVDDLVGRILASIARHDPSISDILLPFPSGTPLIHATPLRFRDPRQARIDRILEALRNGAYFVAIDSMGEFGRGYLSHNSEELPTSRRASDLYPDQAELYEFLLYLTSLADTLCDSRIAFCLTPPAIPVPEYPSNSDTPLPEDVNTLFKADIDALSIQIPSFEPTVDWPAQRNVETEDSDNDASSLPYQGQYTLPPVPKLDVPDHYIIKHLGAGGTADTYLVGHSRYPIRRVLKVLRPIYAADDYIAKRFLEEGLSIARLWQQARDDGADASKHLVEVVTAGRLNDTRPYILSQHTPSVSFADVLKQGASGLPFRIRVLTQIASALAYAHTNGIVHRDVKPGNILVDRQGIAYLIDFGLAFHRDLDGQPSHIGGTLPYMSPEHFEPEKLSPLSDIYSFGITLYESLCGARPFRTGGGAGYDSIRSVDVKAPHPHTYNSTAPAKLCDICLKCIEKDPALRYKSIATVAAVLNQWLDWYSRQSEHASQPRMVGHVLRLAHEEFRVRLRDTLASSGATAVPAAASLYKYLETEPSSVFSTLLRRDRKCFADSYSDWICTKGNNVLSAVGVLWPHLHGLAQSLLGIASVFRRPRSIVTLRWLARLAIRHNVTDVETFLELVYEDVLLQTAEYCEVSAVPTSRMDPFSPAQMFSVRWNEQADSVLEDLETADFVIRQEGGLYWMHCSVRNYVYSQLHEIKCEDGKLVAGLHLAAGLHYYNAVFLPTRDVSALYETMFQFAQAARLGSITIVKRSLARLRWLVSSEAMVSTGSGESGRILRLAGALDELCEEIMRRMTEEGAGDVADVIENVQRLRQATVTLRIAIYRAATNYERCIQLYLEDIYGVPSFWRAAKCRKSFVKFIMQMRARTHLSEKQYEEMCVVLTSAVRNVREGISTHRPPPAAVRSALSTIRDVAECLGGLQLNRLANTLLVALADCADRLQHYHGDVIGAEDGAVFAARCLLRKLDLNGTPVHMWSDSRSRQAYVESVGENGQLVARLLEEFSPGCEAQYSRYCSVLRIHQARAHYLSGRFDDAYALLREALANLSDGETMASMARLRWCECLLLEADKGIESCGDSGTEQRRRAVRLLLQAGQLLVGIERNLRSGASRNVWAWTLLNLESAQLSHERILLLLDSEDGLPWSLEQEIKHALTCIGNGVDNIAKDRRRLRQFQILWWQIYLCFFVSLCEAGQFLLRDEARSLWERWDELNAVCGIAWFSDEQAQTVRGEIERRLSHWRFEKAKVEMKGSYDWHRDRRAFAIELQRGVLRQPKDGTEFVLASEEKNTVLSALANKVDTAVQILKNCLPKLDEAS